MLAKGPLGLYYQNECPNTFLQWCHMSAMVSHLTGKSTVCSANCSREQLRQHQSIALMALLGGIHQWAVDSPHKGPIMWKSCPCHCVIMITTATTLCQYTSCVYVTEFINTGDHISLSNYMLGSIKSKYFRSIIIAAGDANIVKKQKF